MPRTLTRLMIASALTLAAVSSYAALGEKPSTLAGTVNPPAEQAMARRLSAHVLVANNPFTIHETRLESNTLVREFSNPEGVVFAITWQGPVLPNLQTMLGNYFPSLAQETARAQQAGHQRTRVWMQTPGLVVQSAGRMGRFRGHAYAPNLIPQGVDVQGLLP